MSFIHIAGHLGADAEVRYTSSGKKVVTLRVATKNRRGQNEDTTIWWRVTLWGDQFDKLIPYLKKGSAIMVWGELHKPEIFNDREGKPQVSMEITAVHLQFSPFGRSGSSQHAQQQGEGAPAPSTATPAPPFGVLPEGASSASPSSPYMGAYPAAASKAGETFDDEVPF